MNLGLYKRYAQPAILEWKLSIDSPLSFLATLNIVLTISNKSIQGFIIFCIRTICTRIVTVSEFSPYLCNFANTVYHKIKSIMTNTIRKVLQLPKFWGTTRPYLVNIQIYQKNAKFSFLQISKKKLLQVMSETIVRNGGQQRLEAP